MLNLLRSDFYRLFRSKSFYICVGVQLVLSVISAFVIKWATTQSGATGDTLNNMLPSGGLEYGMTIFSGNIQMILGIIVAIFVTAEFSHGTMKNTVSKGFVKWWIYITKFISMLLMVFMVVLIAFIVAVATGSALFGGLGDLTNDFVIHSLKTAGIELLLFMALTSVFVFVCMLVRNLGGVLAIIILGVLSLEPFIYQIMELISKGKIKFSECSLINNISAYGTAHAISPDYFRSTIVALLYLAVTLALGIYAFHKSDIK